MHEAGHWIYAAALGLNPYTEGPCIWWDEKKDNIVTREAVVYYDRIPASTRPVDAAKVGIASFIFKKELTKTSDKQTTIDYDVQGARDWHAKYHPDASEDEFQVVVKEATEEIMEDLQRQEFRLEALNRAHRIEQQLFAIAASHDGTPCKGHLFLGVNYPPESQL